ncbi:MAG TPA: MarR family transcriptional regulator [Chloroflexota bacterium]|nr:MarR family transcriptional regulator [Chloroflexota bacterium]
MDQDPDVNDVAAALYASISLFVRRLRQAQTDGELTMPENSALARLDRGGPSTPSALARLEQITPQSMGATLAGLEARGLVERQSDPEDGRRVVMSLTESGLQVLRSRRNARAEQVARALSTEFTRSELKQLMKAAPLIERLAQRI